MCIVLSLMILSYLPKNDFGTPKKFRYPKQILPRFKALVWAIMNWHNLDKSNLRSKREKRCDPGYYSNHVFRSSRYYKNHYEKHILGQWNIQTMCLQIKVFRIYRLFLISDITWFHLLKEIFKSFHLLYRHSFYCYNNNTVNNIT